MSTKIAICSNCLHYRKRGKPQLFNLSEMRDSHVMKSELERLQKDEERGQREELRFAAGDPFNYEPFSYPWCDRFTPLDAQLFEGKEIQDALDLGDIDLVKKLAIESNERGKEWIINAKKGSGAALDNLAEHRSAMMNPVSGEIMQIYALCARMNPKGGCLLFEPKN